MAHPQLASYALYRVPRISENLSEIGLPVNASGYAELERQIGKMQNNSALLKPINRRTVELMMYQGGKAKHVTCTSIVGNINLARSEKGLVPLEIEQEVEEYEWYIQRLKKRLQEIAQHNGVSYSEVLNRVAAESRCGVDFLTEMTRHLRCRKSDAEAVKAAIKRLYGDILSDHRLQLPLKNERINNRKPHATTQKFHLDGADED